VIVSFDGELEDWLPPVSTGNDEELDVFHEGVLVTEVKFLTALLEDSSLAVEDGLVPFHGGVPVTEVELLKGTLTEISLAMDDELLSKGHGVVALDCEDEAAALTGDPTVEFDQ
jgi:hypothetical protein